MRSRTLLSLAAALLMLAAPASGRVVVYPDPGLTDREDARASSRYSVSVSQGENTYDSFVYEIAAKKRHPWRHAVCSFSTFSFLGRVTVEVTQRGGDPIRSAQVYPSNEQIEVQIVDEQTVRFTLDGPRKKLAVIFNDDWDTHPLLIFGDELERDPPTPDAADTHYFGPGVHHVGRLRIKSGETVYLAGGAYVIAHIDESELNHVTIRGRGVLSAEHIDIGGGKQGINTIDLVGDNPNNIVVEGITFVQSDHFACRLRGYDNHIANIKVVGCWHVTTDGVNVGRDGVVEDCFFKCNDDAVKLYSSGQVVRRCVFWQMENGAPFQISWNNNTTREGIHVYDCDIIRFDGRDEGKSSNRANNGIISSVAGRTTNRDVLFEDIRAEHINGRLFSLNIDPDGLIENIRIRNFSVTHWNLNYHNVAIGPVRNVVFENLVINGEQASSPEAARFLEIKDGAQAPVFAP